MCRIDYLSPSKSKPYVFICSPFAGDVAGNIHKAIRYMRFAIAKGSIPFAPHLLYPQVLDEDDPADRELGLTLGTAWIINCDEIWVFGRQITDGMAREIAKAMKHDIPIRYFDQICEEEFE